MQQDGAEIVAQGAACAFAVAVEFAFRVRRFCR